jgi:hypothetical protein
MPLDVTCLHCQRMFKLPPEHAGQLAVCPHCSKDIRIPSRAARASAAAVVETEDSRWKTPTANWYVQSDDGKQYGPISRELLQVWYEEGRITADCQVLQKGFGRWQWATDLFPDLHETAGSKPSGPVEINPAQPRVTVVRAAPTQSATQITPLSPSDFPTAGSGLRPLGPLLRPLPPGPEEPPLRSEEAMEDRRKFAPYMIARRDRPPLHKMLLVVAIGNFVAGGLRGVLHFVSSLNLLMTVGAVSEFASEKTTAFLAISLAINFLLFALNISIISGGIGLLQQREWGRTATYTGALIGIVVQLTVVCVTVMLGPEGSNLSQGVWMGILVLAVPSIFYDAFAAATLSMPKIVEDLEE